MEELARFGNLIESQLAVLTRHRQIVPYARPHRALQPGFNRCQHWGTYHCRACVGVRHWDVVFNHKSCRLTIRVRLLQNGDNNRKTRRYLTSFPQSVPYLQELGLRGKSTTPDQCSIALVIKPIVFIRSSLSTRLPLGQTCGEIIKESRFDMYDIGREWEGICINYSFQR